MQLQDTTIPPILLQPAQSGHLVSENCRNTIPLEYAAPLHACVLSHSLIHHRQAFDDRSELYISATFSEGACLRESLYFPKYGYPNLQMKPASDYTIPLL